jgi:hypothetical protein
MKLGASCVTVESDAKRDAMNRDIATLGITVILAFSGYLITYLNNVRLSQRAGRLERVNRQLAELYGQLFALSQASDRAWQAFRRKYRYGKMYFDEGAPPTVEELEAWRLWMSTVFMPNNLRMYELVLSKSDLLIESEMPQCLLDFCAHVTAYQTVMKKWEINDFSEHTSLIPYPAKSLNEYIRKSYVGLKAEQQRLLGKK